MLLVGNVAGQLMTEWRIGLSYIIHRCSLLSSRTALSARPSLTLRATRPAHYIASPRRSSFVTGPLCTLHPILSADAGRQAHHLLFSQTTAVIPGSHGVCGLFLIGPLAFPAA
jgi:hypothetical protein